MQEGLIFAPCNVDGVQKPSYTLYNQEKEEESWIWMDELKSFM